MAGQRLLIVENYEPVAQILAAALAGDFERIAMARSLTEARALHADTDGRLFDLVICSSVLPDGQGTDFVILSKPFMMEELQQAIEETRALSHSAQGR